MALKNLTYAIMKLKLKIEKPTKNLIRGQQKQKAAHQCKT